MSWNINHYYSSLRLIGITDHDHFESLLLGFSKELLTLVRANPSSSIEFEDLGLDLELPDEDLISEINEALKRYVKERQHRQRYLNNVGRRCVKLKLFEMSGHR